MLIVARLRLLINPNAKLSISPLKTAETQKL